MDYDKDTRRRRNVVICLNCGKNGHKSVRCQEPIKSFGIIAFKKRKKNPPENKLISENINNYLKENVVYPPPGLGYNSDILYLLIQRRDSIAFVDLMRGNYKNTCDPVLDIYFKEMIPSEKDRLRNNSFQKNSEVLWINKRPNQFKAEHHIASMKFNTLNVKSLIEKNPSKYWYTSFGFPKGRKKGIKESEIECAVREFSEESGYNTDAIAIDPNFYVIEKFIGSDGIHYEQKYWVAECITDEEPVINPNNSEQIGEIGSIGWFKFEEANKLFYEEHSERKRILSEVNDKICNFYS